MHHEHVIIDDGPHFGGHHYGGYGGHHYGGHHDVHIDVDVHGGFGGHGGDYYGGGGYHDDYVFEADNVSWGSGGWSD